MLILATVCSDEAEREKHPVTGLVRRYAIYDSELMRRFVSVELGEDAVPDESTILRFPHAVTTEAAGVQGNPT